MRDATQGDDSKSALRANCEKDIIPLSITFFSDYIFLRALTKSLFLLISSFAALVFEIMPLLGSISLHIAISTSFSVIPSHVKEKFKSFTKISNDISDSYL